MTLHNKNNSCLHNLEIQITKIILLIKIFVPIVIEQIILSPPVFLKKKRDDEDQREACALSKRPQNSLVQYFRSPSNDRTKRHDTRYRSRSTSRTITNITKTQIQKTGIALNQETNSAMTKPLLLHNTFHHDMIVTKEIPNPTVPLIDLLTDLSIDMTLVIDIDQVLIQEITAILQDIHFSIDHLLDNEILDILDHVHIQIQETNSIQYEHNTKRIQLILKSYISSN